MECVGAELASWWRGLEGALAAEIAAQTPPLLRRAGLAQTDAMADVVGGGKKLRGCLTLAVCDALGAPIAAALPSALTVEYVQAASLIHDDLVDGDRTRRQRSAVWVVYGRRRAVLLGDVIFAAALARSAEIGRDEVQTLSRTIARMAAGAYQEPLDGEAPAGSGAAPDYAQIIRLKTGVLFGAAAELGAIAAHAGEGVRRAAQCFGERIGMAYQIADDRDDLVARPPTGPRSPAERATLCALRAHFAGACVCGDEHALARAIEAEIGRHLEAALGALGAFPAGPRRELLAALPEALLDSRGVPAR